MSQYFSQFWQNILRRNYTVCVCVDKLLAKRYQIQLMRRMPGVWLTAHGGWPEKNMLEVRSWWEHRHENYKYVCDCLQCWWETSDPRTFFVLISDRYHSIPRHTFNISHKMLYATVKTDLSGLRLHNKHSTSARTLKLTNMFLLSGLFFVGQTELM